MNRIRLLPEQVANQIAAGEVVERPASIVKELVENALDAQATRITVEIQAGGRSLVRVTDDGLGMSKDDALLCLERHATSKIQRAEDLANILTMGFRGEALPSIASVSRFQLTTRERDNAAPEGTQIVINGGKIIEVKAAGSAPGTSVEVRQIFFNLPARRKFLRSEETERAHIQHYLTLAALAHPEVAFNFVHEGKTVWQLPAAKKGHDISGRLAALQERLRAVHGADLSLISVNHHGRLEPRIEEAELEQTLHDAGNNLHLWGYIGSPGVSRATRDDQNIFVNRRPVENRGLNYALIEGYHTALMKGRYPVCCLFLEIDPAEVDVNIHPAKREVKFHRERDVRQFVANAVRQALLNFHTAPPAPTLNFTSRSRTQSNATTTVAMPTTAPAPAAPAAPPPPAPPAELPELPMLLPPQPAVPIAHWPERPIETPAALAPENSSELETPTRVFTPPPPAPAPAPFTQKLMPAAVPLLAVPLRLVGVVGRLYVVLESDRGMVLMDQHAAHERVLYEQMLARMEHGNAASQRLLLPETVEVSIRDAQFLRSQLSALVRLGVGLSDFGERTFLLDALPPFVKVSDARRFVLELVDELKAAGEGVNSMRLGEHVVAKTVCRHAVKANDPLAGPELENLVNDLRKCAMPYTCPHGRPTLIEMNFKELEKKFGRVQ